MKSLEYKNGSCREVKLLFFSKIMIDMFSRKVADKFLPIYMRRR